MAVKRHPAPSGTYSESVVVDGPGRWVHVSGTLGVDADGALVSGGMYEESVAVFSAISRSLATAGATLADVVRITAYLTDLDSYGDFGRARAEAFGETLPASAAVAVSGLLLGALVEVDAVAFVADRSAQA